MDKSVKIGASPIRSNGSKPATARDNNTSVISGKSAKTTKTSKVPESRKDPAAD